MTLEGLYTKLNSITGFDGKVTYRAFPKNQCPELPFICYLETSTSNFMADGTVYKKIQSVEIELYSRRKDPTSETRIESMLNDENIAWEKTEYYIESEKCIQIIYEITI